MVNSDNSKRKNNLIKNIKYGTGLNHERYHILIYIKEKIN